MTQTALIGALLACLSGLGGYVHGIGVGEAREQATQKRAMDAMNVEREKLQAQIDASAERYQTEEYARQNNVREIYHESEKIIERPVYRNVCVDADGVGLLDRAAATANGEHILPAAGVAAETAARPEN